MPGAPHLLQTVFDRRDAGGLCAAQLPLKLLVPLPVLRSMCDTIVRMYAIDARFLGETRRATLSTR